MELKSSYIATIDGSFNSPLKKYTDGWSMISDLEDRLEISEENMEEFINTLKTLNVPLAVNALTKGSGNKRRNIDSSDQPENKRARTTPKFDLTRELVDSAGGDLELANIKLIIPEGAISEGEQLVEISLGHVIRDAYDIQVSNKLESRISPIVTCRPSGMVFKKPCLLSFPHNAVNEEWWKFTVLVRDNSSGTWKRTDCDDQHNISVRKGRCYIETKYFSDFTLLGLIRNASFCKRSLNLGLFGKHIHPEAYLLKVRIWNGYDNKCSGVVDIQVSNKLESRISPIVTCRPSGMVFKKPCLLSFPHNAVNEEWWKFTVLVRDNSSGSWKRTDCDDQHNISVRKGRCYIETKYFSDFTLLGLIRNASFCKRSLNLGLFGKHIHPEAYLLKVRIWNGYDNKLVLEDENKLNEKKLAVYPSLFAMYKDIEVIIDNLDNGLKVEGDTKVVWKLEAPLLWFSNPSHEFQLKTESTSIQDLHAKISTTQGSGHIHERPLHTPLKTDH
ncbi:uncharacterized protein LOC117114590 [Anneissia japonica]|uniref:uncharacterized protein LOC117114590 n=1 Tax=Anneissia japonica TaxID=1529436 RepID=UPI001425B45B|nr:uncharacterized protein LOC117114590 [Anneissia japonica]